MNETYYTVEQVSEMLNIHPKTIQRYIREGKLRAVKLGKSWRITGHDLSRFTENGLIMPYSDDQNASLALSVTASAVIDIAIRGKEDAVRIMNALTAASISKPPEYGRSSLQSQYIVEESKVRLSLWGGVRFMAAIMESVAYLTEEDGRND
ncbi:helix-turn-helix domain-containing protein [Oscillospiraceae bacterium WX1]